MFLTNCSPRCTYAPFMRIYSFFLLLLALVQVYAGHASHNLSNARRSLIAGHAHRRQLLGTFSLLLISITALTLSKAMAAAAACLEEVQVACSAAEVEGAIQQGQHRRRHPPPPLPRHHQTALVYWVLVSDAPRKARQPPARRPMVPRTTTHPPPLPPPRRPHRAVVSWALA